MRIIHCECSAVYTGRGDTILPKYQRVIMIKEDGAVMIHSDEGIKPLNYMTNKPKLSVHEEFINDEKVITFENSKESLTITFHSIFSDINLGIQGGDPGLQHDGTEAQLQEWLANNIKVLHKDYDFIQREFNTEHGTVDLLAFNKNTNKYVLIEVKRTATTAAIHQLKRYIEGVEDEDNIVDPERLLVAFKVTPKAREKARKLGTPWIELSKEENGYVYSYSSYQEENDLSE